MKCGISAPPTRVALAQWRSIGRPAFPRITSSSAAIVASSSAPWRTLTFTYSMPSSRTSAGSSKARGSIGSRMSRTTLLPGFRSAGRAEPPELLVLPETALTGYFVEGAVRELARSAEDFYSDLAAVHAESGAPPLDIMVGFFELRRSRLHNSALAATLGGPDAGIRHVHRKVFLPTYGVFDEERFVEPGHSVRAFDTRWG